MEFYASRLGFGEEDYISEQMSQLIFKIENKSPCIKVYFPNGLITADIEDSCASRNVVLQTTIHWDRRILLTYRIPNGRARRLRTVKLRGLGIDVVDERPFTWGLGEDVSGQMEPISIPTDSGYYHWALRNRTTYTVWAQLRVSDGGTGCHIFMPNSTKWLETSRSDRSPPFQLVGAEIEAD